MHWLYRYACLGQKNPQTTKAVCEHGCDNCRWRRRRDSNSRDAFDAYTISSRAPSTKLGDSSVYDAISRRGCARAQLFYRIPEKKSSNTALPPKSNQQSQHGPLCRRTTGPQPHLAAPRPHELFRCRSLSIVAPECREKNPALLCFLCPGRPLPGDRQGSIL